MVYLYVRKLANFDLVFIVICKQTSILINGNGSECIGLRRRVINLKLDFLLKLLNNPATVEIRRYILICQNIINFH